MPHRHPWLIDDIIAVAGWVNPCRRRLGADHHRRRIGVLGGWQHQDMAERGGDFAGDVAECAERYRHGIQRIPLALQEVEYRSSPRSNGPAIGAGFDLANMADIRIASEKARFGETFLNLGIIPGDGGAWFMQRLIGYQQAFELTLSGRIIDAAEAKSLGVVLEVVAPEHLMVRATGSPAASPPSRPRRCASPSASRKWRSAWNSRISSTCARPSRACATTNPSISWRCSACCRNNSWAVSQRGRVSSIDSRSFPMRMRPASRRLAVPRAGLGAGSSQRHRGRGHRTS